MIQYNSISQHEIEGRGKVFVVENEKDRTQGKNELVGQTVLIDGKEYYVIGVEYFTLRQGYKIGLLVKNTD